MHQDKLAKHRKVDKRENPDAFSQWLQTNCHHAVSHDRLRDIAEKKKKIIEDVIESTS